MSRNSGRPRKNNILVSFNVPATVISTLKSERPNLLKPNSTEFRHGALGGYLESLIWKDLRGTAKYEVKSQVMGDGLVGGESADRTAESGTDTGRILHEGQPIEGRDVITERRLSSSGSSNTSTPPKCFKCGSRHYAYFPCPERLG